MAEPIERKRPSRIRARSPMLQVDPSMGRKDKINKIKPGSPEKSGGLAGINRRPQREYLDLYVDRLNKQSAKELSDPRDKSNVVSRSGLKSTAQELKKKIDEIYDEMSNLQDVDISEGGFGRGRLLRAIHGGGETSMLTPFEAFTPPPSHPSMSMISMSHQGEEDSSIAKLSAPDPSSTSFLSQSPGPPELQITNPALADSPNFSEENYGLSEESSNEGALIGRTMSPSLKTLPYCSTKMDRRIFDGSFEDSEAENLSECTSDTSDEIVSEEISDDEFRDQSDISGCETPLSVHRSFSSIVSARGISLNTSFSSLSEDAEDSDSGFKEERSMKIKILYILIHIFLLRENIFNNEPSSIIVKPFNTSRSHSNLFSSDQSNENYNKNAQEVDSSPSSGDKIDGYTSSTDQNQIQYQDSSQHTRKRKRTDEEYDGEGEDEPPNKKNSMTGLEARDILKKLACPFVKGDPGNHISCLMIARRDLSGIKEHLKRNHEKEKVPQNIRKYRTWEQLFHVCFPKWNQQNETPSKYFDIKWIMEFLSSKAHPISIPRSLNTSTTGKPEMDSKPMEIDTQNQENMLKLNHGILSFQTKIPQSINEVLEIGALTSPHMPWPLTEALLEEYNRVSGLLLEDSNIDVTSDPKEQYQKVSEIFELSSLDKSGEAEVGPSSDTWHFDERDLDSLHIPKLPMGTQDGISDFPQSMLLQSSPEATVPSLSQDSSHVTSPPISASCPISKRTPQVYAYNILVAMRGPGGGKVHQFDFSDYDNFLECFQGWMENMFIDPGFSWETMEFLSADPQIDARFSSVEEVLGDIKMWCIRHRTKEAAVYFERKEKRKKSVRF